MGLMIFGQKFDIGDCFIVLSNCRKSENGYYGAIFSYQLSYNNNYVALRSCNMLQMKTVPNFVNEPNPIIIPTIRPFFNEALNGLYTYYTNWAVGIGGGGGKRGGQLRVDQAERFFRTLGQIPQDGQFFEMTDDNGKRAVYKLIEFRGDNDFPYRNDRKRFIRSEPWIEYTDLDGNYHSASVIDIYKRDIVSLGGTPTMLLNPGECFCEVARNKGGEIISIVSSCYMCTEWRRGYIDGIEQRYMDMIEWHGYTECRRIDKYSKDVFTEKKLSDGFMSGRYVKVDAAYGGVHCKVMMYQHISDFFKIENERKVNNK